MSSYCSPSDVGVLLQLTYSATSQPTTTQVQAICDQVTAEINMKLRQIGIVGVTDSTVLDQLKLICSQGAACYVGGSYFNNIQSTSGTISNFYCTNYKEKLKEIVDDPAMYGAAGGRVSFDSNVTAGITSEAEVNELFIGNGFNY